MSVLSSLTFAAVSVLARRPAEEATFLSTLSHSTLSLQLGGSAAGLSEFCDSDSQFLSSATQEDLQSSAALACIV